MSLPIRRLFICVFFFSLTACGFQPMYGDQVLPGGNTPMRGNIAIDPIPNRDGQVFKIALEDKFNPEGLATTNAEYHLSVVLNKSLVPSVVKSDSTIQRYEVRFNSTFRLFKKGVAAPIFSGELRRSGSYNAAINANFATYEAGEDVTNRTMDEMAEDYVLRISGYLAGQHDTAKVAAPVVAPPPIKAPATPPASLLIIKPTP